MRTDIVFATMTWAHSDAEADALADSLSRLAEHDCWTVIADGGSVPRLYHRLQQIPNLIVQPYEPHPGPRLLTQVQSALEIAGKLGPRAILYTEPDKAWFFAHWLGDLLHIALDEELGMALASRDEASFQTFPAGQQLTESLMNRLAAEMLGQDGDYCYGPLLLSPRLLPYLAALEEDLGWGWRFYALGLAHRLGLPIRLWTADLPCPKEQRGEDDLPHRLYRMEQLAQNVKGLALGMKVPLEYDRKERTG